MAVTHNYMAYVVDKLTAMGPIKTRRMFNGVGIYREDTIFAIIANNTLYFKAGAASRPDFEALGMPAFQPVSEDSQSPAYAQSPAYYQVPDTVLNDRNLLATWAERACAPGLIKGDAEISLAG